DDLLFCIRGGGQPKSSPVFFVFGEITLHDPLLSVLPEKRSTDRELDHSLDNLRRCLWVKKPNGVGIVNGHSYTSAELPPRVAVNDAGFGPLCNENDSNASFRALGDETTYSLFDLSCRSFSRFETFVVSGRLTEKPGVFLKNYHPNRKVSGELFIRGDARNLESAGTLIHDTTCFVQKRQSPPPGQPQAQSRSSQFPKRLPAAQGVPGSDRC